MSKWSFDTKAIHSGFNQDSKTGATSLPIYQTAAFAYNTAEELADVFSGRKFGYLYSRISNPTVTALERRVAALEDGVCALACSSGMAAIATAIYTLAKSGDHIVSSRSLYGGTLQLFSEIFEENGIEIDYVDTTDSAAYEAAIKGNTRLIFVESLGNPKLDVPPFEAIAKIAAAHQIPLIVDSTLTTPYLFNPKAWGVAVVIHSATKYLAGSGHVIGGILVDLGTFNWKQSKSPALAEEAKKFGEFAFIARARKKILQNTGSCIAPLSAYLLNLGLETLGLRMKQHCDNALALATFLENHPGVKEVGYTGLVSNPHHRDATRYFNRRYGGLLTFRLDSKESCYKFINSLKLAKNLANLGDSKTLVIHPASTIYCDIDEKSQQEAGVYCNLIRVSVGIEDPTDIIADFEQALKESLQ